MAAFSIDVLIPNDADNDGLPDDYERTNGLNPNDPSDAALDLDGDGLTNLQEFQRGTDPRRADTDGDGIADGDEIAAGTNPTNPDSDGDGLGDGRERDLGLNPLAPDPLTAVTGNIEDADGSAVAGAAAVVFGQFVGTSNGAGAFTVLGVPANRGDVVVEARIVRSGVVSDGVSGPTPPNPGGTTDVGVIRLAPVTGRVTGRVLSPRGVPVPSARVTVTASRDVRQVNADVTGTYRVDRLSAGAVTVAAIDARTGLRGQASGVLAEGGSAVIDVSLGASGTIFGTVFGRDGVTAVGPGVTVVVSGPVTRMTQTGPGGEYLFDFVPLGFYQVDATDGAGNHGRTITTITGTAKIVEADVGYLGRGRVTGRVETATGQLVGGAAVTVYGLGIFGGQLDTTTDARGEFVFDGVFVGPLFVSARAGGLGGGAGASIDFEGDSEDVTVMLSPAGDLTGMVLESNGTTPVPGAVVQLSSGQQTTANAGGVYHFDRLPLGTYTISATNPLNDDRGRSVAVLDTADEEILADVRLNGLGTVNVTVLDGAGALVPGAQVTIASGTIFGGSRQATTGGDGRAQVTNVLAGDFIVSAFDPVDRLGGSIASSVLVGETIEVTVTLEASGNIVGTVLGPDGATPVPNVRVHLTPLGKEVFTAADGAFRFDMVPIAQSPYRLEAFQANGGLRGSVNGITLTAQGQEVRRNIVLDGLGTVTGTVFNPNGSPAAGVGVTLDTVVSGFPDFFATADAQGVYVVRNVPEGAFTVSARDPAARSAGATAGDVTFDGEVVRADVQLLENQIPPTAQNATIQLYYDANGFEYAVQQTGAVQDGNTQVWRGDGGANRGGMRLDLVEQGTLSPFAGVGGLLEDGGREVALPATDPSGLLVTRKVFVPRDGYFARYLEELRNPTGNAITVDVRVDSHFRFIQQTRNGFRFNEPPRIVSTSSGDEILTVSAGTPDQWVVIDDNENSDPFLVANLPTVAHVFDGPGGSTRTALADFTVDFAAQLGRLRTEWRQVIVPPGQTLIFMHFAVQETSRAGAQAAAERLAQLPPEALTGLSANERLQIVNFAVPGDGMSPVAPLPALDGTVTGTVLEGDGSTSVPSAPTRFVSSHPLFGRTLFGASNQDGLYQFASHFDDVGGSVPIPRDGFTVGATHPQSGHASPPATGAFAPGSPTASQDIVFSDTGIVVGTVRRLDGTVVSTGRVDISGGGLLTPFSVPIAVDGLYAFRGIPPGRYTLIATLPISGGTGLAGSTSADVSAGTTTTADITIAPSGGVTGIVRTGAGNPAISLGVDLVGANGFLRQTQTDTAARYAFLDVPTGTFTVRAFEPNTGLPSSAVVTVVQDQVTNQDLTLVTLGTVAVQATFAGGGPVAGAPVQILRVPLGNYFAAAGTTDATGRHTVPNVPVGAFRVRVFNPSNTQLFGEASGTMPANGGSVVASVTVPVDRPPQIQITSPAANSVFFRGAFVTIVASVTDDLGTRQVDYLVDGVPVGTTFSDPTRLTFQLLPPAGVTQVALTAVATDLAFNQTTSAPVQIQVATDGTVPVVDLTAPANGASVVEGRPIALQATASDNVAVARVEFRANGTLIAIDTATPYQAVFTPPATYADAGPTPLTLSATAIDPSGLTATDSATVTVLTDHPPVIGVTQAPADGSTHVEGTTVVFEASATDDVAITNVDLLVDGVLTQTRSLAPYRFNLVLPTAAAPTIHVVLRARDTLGQTTSTAAVTLHLITDQPPSVMLTAPAAGIQVVEGTRLTLSATATDDVAVSRVDFFYDGTLAGSDATAPYSVQARVPGGADGSTVVIRAVAVDARGQTAQDSRSIIRRDDTTPPTIGILAPSDGAVVSVGESDLMIVIDTSGSTADPIGTDVDGNPSDVDTILEAEVAAARSVLDFLNPTVTQVGIVAFNSTATLVQPLTTTFADVEQALDAILATGPFGGTNFASAASVATSELIGPRSRAGATPVQLFMSDGAAPYPSAQVQEAIAAGLVINTFAVGSEADPVTLQQMAQATGGVFTPVTDPAALVDLLPNIVLFGIDALAVTTTVTDETAVERVTFRFVSDDGTIDQTLVDVTSPFTALFTLPALDASTGLTVTATARDFGGNETTAPPVHVTLLPAENPPQITGLSSTVGAPGDFVQITGRFFSPNPTENLVAFNGLPASVFPFSGLKTFLYAIVPVGATDGQIVVTVDGRSSNGVAFALDTDRDGLRDAQERALGTDPNDPDTDDDGLTDGNEVARGTNPLLADTDHDGLPDGYEVSVGFNPLNPADGAADSDGDGLTNAEEFAAGTSPFDSDSDDDGLSDGFEVHVAGTNPLSQDSDGDGLRDGFEVIAGLDPLDPGDATTDPDGDGLTNLEEQAASTNPHNPDTDGDGLTDGAEVHTYGTDPIRADTDRDGLTDGDELFVYGTDPLRRDTDGGGRNDGEEINAQHTNPLDPTDDRPIGLRLLGSSSIQGTNPRSLFEIDRTTGVATLIGSPANVPNGLSDVSADPITGVIYAIHGAANRGAEVLALDSASGAFVSRVPITSPFAFVSGSDALTHDDSGNLYVGALSPGRLLRVNPATGVAISDTVVNGGDGFEHLSDLAFDPTTGDLWASRGGNSPGRIDRIAPATATVVQVLNVPGSPDITAVAVDPTNGDLYASLNGQRLALIDKTTGAATFVGTGFGGAKIAGLGFAGADSDHDGLDDEREFDLGTDPHDPDSDDDGLLDGFEVRNGLDPLAPDDSTADPDGDGLSTLEEQTLRTKPFDADTDDDGLSDGDEVHVYGTSPLRPDTDGDGLSDGTEVGIGSNPLDADSDHDGLTDPQEVARGTNPTNADTDGDGLNDGLEVQRGLNPLNPNDASADFDGDGLTNAQEIALGTNLFDSDSDDDGLTDGNEIGRGTNPLAFDTDGGGRSDGEETLVDGTNPLNPADDAPSTFLPTTLLDGNGFRWDIRGDGAIVDGTNNAFDIDLFLQVNNTFFPGFSRARTEDAGRELLIGPASIGALRVARKVFVPTNDAFARYLEILGNPTTSAVSASVTISGNVGFGAATVFVSTSSSPEGAFDVDDDWIITDDGNGEGRPAVAQAIAGPTGVVRPTAVSTTAPGGGLTSFTYQLTVPAGGKVIVMHFASQSPTRSGETTVGACTQTELLPLQMCVAESCAGGDLSSQVGCIVTNCSEQLFSLSGQCLNCLAAGVGSGLDLTQIAAQCIGGFVPGADVSAAHLRALQGSTLNGLASDERAAIVNFFAQPDADGDGLADDAEPALGTNPNDSDTDDDGLVDGFEVRSGLDPLDPVDGTADPDGDGLDNLGEQAARTDPHAFDTDGDGLSDGDEVSVYGTHPRRADSDGDGLTDGAEIGTYGTDPLLADTDAGGRSDGDEVLADGTDPLVGSDDLHPVSLPLILFDGAGFRWDISGDGSIADGTSDAFDGGLHLRVDGTPFPFVGTGDVDLAGRQVTIGPSVLPSGLLIHRKVFVPTNDAFARFLEVLENPTNGLLTATLQVDTNLGSDFGTVLVATSSADGAFTTLDDFIVTDDVDGAGDPTVAHIFSGPGARVEPATVLADVPDDDVQFTFVVDVPPHGRAIVMHFATQSPNQTTAIAGARRLELLGDHALDGLTAAELDGLQNFDNAGDGLRSGEEGPAGTDKARVGANGDGLVSGREPNDAGDLVDLGVDRDASSNGLEIARSIPSAPNTVAARGAKARDASGRPKMKKPKHGMQIMIGPVDVPSGSEITQCTYFKSPARHDMAVNRVRIEVTGGSHHIHIYRPVDATMSVADGHETCNFALNFDVWKLILASQNLSLDWKLPPGVAFMFRGGEQLAAQTHFVDNGLLSTPNPGWAGFNLYAMKKRKVKSFAGSFFGQDRDVTVPAHSTATATTRCLFPRPVKLLALTGHYHFRGKQFTASAWDGNATGEQLYRFDGYSEPTFQRFSGFFQPEVPGIEWTCRYQNDTDNDFTFGPFTDRNEHCNLFGFYYPAVGEDEFMTCVQKDAVVTVDVRH